LSFSGALRSRRKEERDSKKSHNRRSSRQSDQNPIPHGLVWNEGEFVEVAKEVRFKLPPVVGVPGHAARRSAYIHARAFAVVGIKTVHWEDPENVDVLSVE
jgi:hypothetical protein